MPDLVIDNWSQGIGPSPETGFGDMRNVDIYTIPGVLRLNNLTVKSSSSTVTAMINWMVKNPATPAEVYALDDNGVVYKSTNSGVTWSILAGNTQTNAHGNGLGIWQNYLFVARDTALDVCGDGTATGITSGNWTNSWKTIDSDVLWHPMLSSVIDSKLYIGAGRYIASLEELTTFAPGDGGTYTWTAQALDLPENYRAKCLADLGSNLMIGTWMGTNPYDIRMADLFPWDRSSPSYGTPLILNDFGIHSLTTVGNLLMMQVGIEGKVYMSDGVSATIAGEIPNAIASRDGGVYLNPYPGGAMFYKDRYFFGLNAGGSYEVPGAGIWSLKATGNGNTLVHEHTISTGNDGSDSAVRIGGMVPVSRDAFVVGWQDGATYGIDKTTNLLRYTSYGGYVESPIFHVGTNLRKKMFTEGEIQLEKPLAADQGVRIKYRTSRSAAFTTIGTYDFSALGAITGHTFVPGIPSTDLLQLRIEVTTGSSNETPEIRSVILR